MGGVGVARGDLLVTLLLLVTFINPFFFAPEEGKEGRGAQVGAGRVTRTTPRYAGLYAASACRYLLFGFTGDLIAREMLLLRRLCMRVTPRKGETRVATGT